MERLMSLVGLIALLAIAWGLSQNRRRINWRTILVGLVLQFALGLLLLKWEPTALAFRWFTDRVAEFLDLADQGAAFVFGELANQESFGFIFAVKVAPIIIFFSAFISICYYLGLVQLIIRAIAVVMHKLMRTSGAETLSCAGNIFVGMTESPLLIRPYLNRMTMSELHAVMVGGFATIAGSVLAAYIGFGISANHLIIASVMSAPAALVIAKLMAPETEHSETAGDVKMPRIDVGENILDAAARGTTDGLRLAVNVVAMLIAFIGLIAVVDWVLGGIDGVIDGRWLGGEAFSTASDGQEFRGIFPGSLRTLFGILLAPLAFLMGVPWSEAPEVGHLLGIKICANEMIAYGNLSELMKMNQLSPRSITIATYALCGFANFASIGIQLGGIGAIAPGRRTDLARLGLRAMAGGALASWTTATIAGLLI